MTKTEFVLELTERLSPLSWNEIEERLTFYLEMINDRMEDGLSEEEAVSAAGSVDEIAAQIVSDIPLSRLVKEKIKSKKRLAAWEIVLLALGSPVWISLLIAAFAVFLSLYVVLWSLILSIWSAFVSFIVCALGGIALGAGFAFGGSGPAGIAVVGAGLVCAGLSIFLFYGCRAATKGTLLLTRNLVLRSKSRLITKEDA